jgi:hypothetical protein
VVVRVYQPSGAGDRDSAIDPLDRGGAGVQRAFIEGVGLCFRRCWWPLRGVSVCKACGRVHQYSQKPRLPLWGDYSLTPVQSMRFESVDCRCRIMIGTNTKANLTKVTPSSQNRVRFITFANLTSRLLYAFLQSPPSPTEIHQRLLSSATRTTHGEHET